MVVVVVLVVIVVIALVVVVDCSQLTAAFVDEYHAAKLVVAAVRYLRARHDS